MLIIVYLIKSRIDGLESMKNEITDIKHNLMGNQEAARDNITDRTVKVSLISINIKTILIYIYIYMIKWGCYINIYWLALC